MSMKRPMLNQLMMNVNRGVHKTPAPAEQPKPGRAERRGLERVLRRQGKTADKGCKP